MYFSKINKMYLISLATAILASACGPAPRNNAGGTAPVTEISPAASYVTAAPLAAAPVDPQNPAAVESNPTTLLPKGSEVTVLETKTDQNGISMVRLGIDSDNENQPSDVWVTQAEALKAGLILRTAEIDPALTAENDDDLTEEAAAKRRMTYCYRFVKQYLLQTGKVNTYLPGGSAWMAAGTLPRYGFHRTGTGPEGAIEGDVCVYSGGNGGNGHIEVKRGGGWWYGYGVKSHPITRVNHPFLGCFRK